MDNLALDKDLDENNNSQKSTEVNHPLDNEVFVVIGHGQLGYMLADRIRTFGLKIHHLSHKDKIPSDATLIFNCIPARHQH